MPQLTVTEAHEAISQAAQSADPNLRHVEAIAVGEFARQGDLYLTRIDKPSAGWRPTDDRQLAPGVSNGSRHVAEGAVSVSTSPESNPVARQGSVPRLLGPQIVAKERFTITHPEHAHVSLPAGTYQCSYQLDYARQQAVRD